MRILALDGASAGGAGYGLVEQRDGVLHASRAERDDRQGAAVRLPALVDRALRDSGWNDGSLSLVAVLVGPGSFTGLRASLALAHGIGFGLGAELVGVTVGEALAPLLCGTAATRPVWCASRARRDRVFIETVAADGGVGAPVARMLDALPDPAGPPLLAGDAQEAVAAALAVRGVAAGRASAHPSPVAIAAAALRRRAGLLPPLAAQPLYVDPPEARPGLS